MRLASEARDHDAADANPHPVEEVEKAQRVLGVGNAEVRASLVSFDVIGVERDQDLGIVCEAREHSCLEVGFESGENA